MTGMGTGCQARNNRNHLVQNLLNYSKIWTDYWKDATSTCSPQHDLLHFGIWIDPDNRFHP
jgi:hypothetical protein